MHDAIRNKFGGTAFSWTGAFALRMSLAPARAVVYERLCHWNVPDNPQQRIDGVGSGGG